MSELAFNRVILERNNFILSWFSLGSIALNIVFGLVLIFLVNRPPLIVFEKDNQIQSIELKDFHLNEQILKDFTRMIAKEYLSFTPTSLPAQIEGISKYLTSQPLESILDSYEKNQQKIKEKNVFHQFTVDQVQIAQRKNPFKIEVSGLKTIYVDGNQKSEQVRYIFEMKQIKPSNVNPYGLVVTQITEAKEVEQAVKS